MSSNSSLKLHLLVAFVIPSALMSSVIWYVKLWGYKYAYKFNLSALVYEVIIPMAAAVAFVMIRW